MGDTFFNSNLPTVSITGKARDSKMKVATISLLSLTCLLGLIFGIYADGYGQSMGGYSYQAMPYYGGYPGYGYGYGQGGAGGSGGFGNGGFLALIGLLFLLLLLFSNTSSSTNTSIGLPLHGI